MHVRTLLIAMSLGLAGCLAVPHLDVRSPEVRGRVVDSRTGQPLADARVEFVENTALAALTDAQGVFVIDLTRKPELFVPLGSRSGYNIGLKIPPRLRVTRDGYAPQEIDGSSAENIDPGSEPSERLLRLRPIALEVAEPRSADTTHLGPT